MNRYREALGNPDELLVKSRHRQNSYKLPVAIIHLLDIKLEQTNSGLEQAGEERATRNEMIGMLIATAGREDTAGLSLEDRILRYREMTVGDLLPELETTSIS